MTPTDVQTLVDDAPLPAGFTMTVTPQRKWKYRSLWDVRVFKDGERIHGRSYYNVAAGIVEAQRWAWEQAGVRA